MLYGFFFGLFLKLCVFFHISFVIKFSCLFFPVKDPDFFHCCFLLGKKKNEWNLKIACFSLKDLRCSSQSSYLKDFGFSCQNFLLQDLRCSSQFFLLMDLRLRYYFFSTEGFEIFIFVFPTQGFEIFISKFSIQGFKISKCYMASSHQTFQYGNMVRLNRFW